MDSSSGTNRRASSAARGTAHRATKTASEDTVARGEPADTDSSRAGAREPAARSAAASQGGAPAAAQPDLDGVDRIQQAWLRERPGTPVASIGVITRIWRLAKILDDDRRRTMTRLGVDAATLDLLSTLRRAGPPYRLAPSEIARRTLVSAGAVTQRVARAERASLVRRTRSDSDGRGVLVELTSDGHELVERTVDELLRHEENLLEGLDPTQREQLSDLLRILLRDLTRRFDLPDRP